MVQRRHPPSADPGFGRSGGLGTDHLQRLPDASVHDCGYLCAAGTWLPVHFWPCRRTGTDAGQFFWCRCLCHGHPRFALRAGSGNHPAFVHHPAGAAGRAGGGTCVAPGLALLRTGDAGHRPGAVTGRDWLAGLDGRLQRPVRHTWADIAGLRDQERRGHHGRGMVLRRRRCTDLLAHYPWALRSGTTSLA